MEIERKQVRKNETFLRCSENSQHCYHPLGITILSFAEDDKLRPGEDVTSATGMTKISMKNSKCAMSKQKKKDGRPSRYKKYERKKKTREERARNRARVKKLQKKTKNCQKMKRHQPKNYRNVVPTPWEINNICRALPEAKYG